ncbi:MAG: hypothetical protein HYR56_13060 [Acidobacteria bacterium]|nr:hypothetical protein [Acidobacteriota bacterium]MBI3423703.1 hypothetical protein [Acidobacteriota bacterium]
MLTNLLLKPIRSWMLSLHEETRLLRTETAGLRHDIAAMRSDVRDVMEMITKLMGELKQLKEQLPIEHESDFEEDDAPKWQM